MKRLWGVRHVRWLWHSWMLARHVVRCHELGLGVCVNPSDLEWLDRVWFGAE
jgi:hypothetical protein